jgi:malate dehydrogenase
MGMAGVLDSARFRAFIAQRAGVRPSEVDALVIEGHGDLMVPAVSRATVSGTPLREATSEQEIDELVDRTRNAGGQIVFLLKDASAFYAPPLSGTQNASTQHAIRQLPTNKVDDSEQRVYHSCDDAHLQWLHHRR